MREITDGLGHNPIIGFLAVISYWMTQIVGNVNEIVSMLTGLGALVLLSLTIVGKWHEVKKYRRKADKVDSGDSGSASDND